MLDFWNMIGTYNDRKVDRFETDLFTIDTALVTDRELPYETAIAHKNFNNGEWIILGWRRTKEDAQKFHNEMVAYYTCHGETVQKIEDVYEHVMYIRKEKNNGRNSEV